MLTPDQKIEHLKRLGISGDFSEVLKMYEGKEFDTEDLVYKKLLKISEELCNEFTVISSDLIKGGEIAEEAFARKQQIIDILFPGHGMVSGGGDDLKAVIGLVDLDGMNYINTRVNFGKTSLVHLGEYVFVANNVNFGDDELVSKYSALHRIEVMPDTWICAGVNIKDDAHVGGGSVITIGSIVTNESKLINNSIVVGNPASSHKIIIPGFVSRKHKPLPQRSETEIKNLLQHVKSLGISGDFKHYIRQLENKEYNALDPTCSKIFDLTHKLCSEYNDPRTSKFRKKDILDIIFFMHGTNLEVGDSLYCDILGTVTIGNNVRIGNGVALCGNIDIGNNVILEDNCLLQAIGHRVNSIERRLCLDEDGNVCEFNVPSFIKIVNGILLREGTKVAGGNIITDNTQENEIIR